MWHEGVERPEGSLNKVLSLNPCDYKKKMVVDMKERNSILAIGCLHENPTKLPTNTSVQIWSHEVTWGHVSVCIVCGRLRSADLMCYIIKPHAAAVFILVWRMLDMLKRWGNGESEHTSESCLSVRSWIFVMTFLAFFFNSSTPSIQSSPFMLSFYNSVDLNGGCVSVCYIWDIARMIMTPQLCAAMCPLEHFPVLFRASLQWR